MVSAGDKIISGTLKNQMDVLRLSETELMKAERLLIDLREELIAKIVSYDPTSVKRTAWQQERLKKVLIEIDTLSKTFFDNQSKSMNEALFEMGSYVAESTVGIVDKAIGVSVMDFTLSPEKLQSIVTKSMIDGELMAHWWSGQADDFKKRIGGVMTQILSDFQSGMLQGQALGSMVTALSPQGALMGYSLKNIEAMIRTSFMQVASDVRTKLYSANKDIFKGTQWLSTLDRRTTPICRALDGCAWDFDKNPVKGDMPYHTPPAHWNCRSTTVPITLTYDEMIKGKPQLKQLSSKERASMNGPVSRDLDYNTWFKSLSVEDQKDILGDARYKLWEKGNLSMSDMVNTKGNAISIKDLKKKVEDTR